MTIEQIENKLEYGDYKTLGIILNTTREAAKMRFKRGDEEAKEALIKIFDAREEFIKLNKKK